MKKAAKTNIKKHKSLMCLLKEYNFYSIKLKHQKQKKERDTEQNVKHSRYFGNTEIRVWKWKV